jgi:hypothetical protein
MLCYVMLCYVMLYYIILYYIILYYIILYYIILYCAVFVRCGATAEWWIAGESVGILVTAFGQSTHKHGHCICRWLYRWHSSHCTRSWVFADRVSFFELCPTSKIKKNKVSEAKSAAGFRNFFLIFETNSRRRQTVSVSHTPASEPYRAALNYVLDTFTASQAVRGVIRQYECGAVQIFGAVTKIKII